MGEVARLQEDETRVVEEAQPMHVLVLGEEEFVCGDSLPITTLIRYADNDLLSLHHILVKLVAPEDHDRMWDTFEGMEADDVMLAIGKLVESYSERPTERPAPSRSGSKSTRRR
jgi:hypothetical protein